MLQILKGILVLGKYHFSFLYYYSVSNKTFKDYIEQWWKNPVIGWAPLQRRQKQEKGMCEQHPDVYMRFMLLWELSLLIRRYWEERS